jgi:hypothetical protein
VYLIGSGTNSGDISLDKFEDIFDGLILILE